MTIELTGSEVALLQDLKRRLDRNEKALLMGNTDRRPMRRLVEAGYAKSQIVGADSTEMCWITDEGREFLRAGEGAGLPKTGDD